MQSEDIEGQGEIDDAREVCGVAGMCIEERDEQGDNGEIGDAGRLLAVNGGEQDMRVAMLVWERGGDGKGAIPGRELGCCSGEMSTTFSECGVIL